MEQIIHFWNHHKKMYTLTKFHYYTKLTQIVLPFQILGFYQTTMMGRKKVSIFYPISKEATSAHNLATWASLKLLATFISSPYPHLILISTKIYLNNNNEGEPSSTFLSNSSTKLKYTLNHSKTKDSRK
jgi:hypothetical protein